MYYSESVLFILLTFIVEIFNSVNGNVEHQPKIRAKDGILLLEAEPDRNITLRLTGASTLMFGDIDVVKVITTKLVPLQLSGKTNDVELTVNLKIEMMTLRTEIERLQQTLLRLQNGTNSWQNRQLSRYMNRAMRLNTRIETIENTLAINECTADKSQPCKNGGECFDAYKDFHCECPDGWSGKTCEEDIDECYYFAGTGLGCQNNAACVNTLGSYRCVCHQGYSGTHCRLRNTVCQSSQSTELCGHGVCVPNKSELNYTCICDQGWTTNKATPTCNVDVDECAIATNPCHSECINLPGGYKCGACPRGYVGDGITCIDIDECATNNGGCSLQPKVLCINTEGSNHCGRCPTGWDGDGRTCTPRKTNNCDTDGICHPQAKCQYISGTAVCTCPVGMSGHGFGANGCNASNAVQDPCDGHQCKNNGVCGVVGRGTRCLCPAGYMGSMCELEEACHNNPCQNGGTCNLLPGNKFRCSCQPGTTGLKCEIIRSTCGSIIRQEFGEFIYPPVGAGLTYEAFERCAWIIRTQDTKVLNITFERFDLEESTECNRDWLQIHDGRTLAAQIIGRFCGKTLPLGGTILSSHNQLFFWFRSDNSTHGSGFKFTWHSQDHVCGGNIDLDASGYTLIRSPGYPGKTPANRDCEWKLIAPFGQRLVLRFYEITLGGNVNCTQDTIMVYDSDRLLKSLCETAKPEPLHTSSSEVVVHLHTDSYAADSLFQLHVEVVPGIPNCGGLYTENSGIISGYMNADVCLYLIQQPVGTKIELQFTKFDLMDSDDCHMQRIEIYDGRTDDDPLIKVLCGNHTQLEPLLSMGHYMLVRYEFALVGFKLNKRFEARYTRVCSERYFGPGVGTITTPNYPRPYYEHLKCVYHIYGPINTIININITDFSLTASIPTDDLVDEDNVNYVDVFLSKDNKHRYYKGEPMQLFSERNYMRIVFNGATNRERARGMRIEYSFDEKTCGGVLTESNGTFALMQQQGRCEWVIEAKEGKQIKLSLSLLYFKCDRDVLAVYTANDILLGSYCSYVNEETYNFNILKIVYTKMIDDHFLVLLRGSYKIVDNTDQCGEHYISRYGVITTPSWPKPYAANLNCTWKITAPKGHQIELRVQNFSLEASFGRCTADVLRITNGASNDSPLIGEYCGNNIPTRIPSFSNDLFLNFRTDASINDMGFRIIWEQTETGCGGKLNSHVGSIHSPLERDLMYDSSLFPKNREVVCEWHITTSKGTTVDLDLEMMFLCDSKLLVIYDGPTSSSKVLEYNCFNSTLDLHSNSNEVLIRFFVPKDSRGRFTIDYKTNCNIVFVEQLQGVIESPNFPDPYPLSTTCLWDIRGGHSNKIMISFSHLEVEMRDGKCEHDFVQIVDMRDDVELSRRNLCQRPVNDITSEGNRLQVRFVSDFTDSRNGFRAEFKRVGCGKHYHSEIGTIETPNIPYSVDVDCSWYIEVEAGKQIELNFLELHIETDSEDCNADRIVVSENSNSSTPLLHECQIQQTPIMITSPANRVYIRFMTSAKRKRKYFRLRFSVKDAICGGVFRSRHGVIVSPNYPNLYAADVDCKWDISVEDSYRIRIRIDVLELQEQPGLCASYLKVQSESDRDPGVILCGPDPPLNPLEINSNKAIVTFKVQLPKAKGKFLLLFERSCSRDFTNSEGFLKAMPYESCNWTINAPEGSHISIDILHIQCQCANETNCRGVTFIPVSSLADNDTINGIDFCHNHQSNIIVPSSSLTIVAQNVNFRAKYATLQSSCGATLSSLQGHIVSPYYPNTYPPNVECTWKIEASRGIYLEVIFDSLDIVKSEHCNDDYLEVRTDEGSTLLGLFCGDVAPIEPLLVYEKIWIKFRSIEGSTGNGFKLNWKHAHNNELNATSGEITAPPLLAARQEEENYAWRIMITPGQYISMQFKEYSAGLNLYDGYDSQAVLVEIKESPWTFISSRNVIYLTTTNADLENFRIVWSTINNHIASSKESNCSFSELVPSNGEITISSPGYPYGYANYLKCNWDLKPLDDTQHLVFKLYALDVEERSQCFDYLRVSTGADLETWNEKLKTCVTKNHTGTPIAVIDGTPYIKVQFISDVSINGTGFTSTVYSVCGSNLTSEYGIILSPPIKTNLKCEWHITVKPSKRILLIFQYENNDIEDEKCNSYVMIHNGSNAYAPILKQQQLCTKNDRKVNTFETFSNHAFVKYVTTEPVDIRWNLTYQAIGDCEDEIRLSDQLNVVNVSTPHYPDVPHPHSECTWTFIAPVGETLQVNFVDMFDLNRRYCNKEYVEIFDGSTTLANSLGRYCFKPTKSLQSTGNVLLIHYQSDISEPRSGFRAQVSVNTCGGFYFNNMDYITSKNYPAPGGYPKMTVCEYTIRLNEQSRIHLNFTDLHLPYNAQRPNTSDRIEIIQVENNKIIESTSYFGNVTQMPNINAESNEVRIRFITYQGGNQYRGFKLRYDRVGVACFREVTGESGTLVLRNLFPLDVFLTCRWRITVPKGQRVRLEMLNVNLNSDAFQISDNQTQQLPTQKFIFYHDMSMQSKITEVNITDFNKSNAIIKSTDNFMNIVIRIKSSGVEVQSRYTSFEESPCPVEIGDADSGLISIENLLNLTSFYCEIPFTVEINETITFKIKEMITNRFDMTRATFAVRFRDKTTYVAYKALNTNQTNMIVSMPSPRGSIDLLRNEAVSLLKFTAEYKRHPCGGTFWMEAKGFVLEYPKIAALYSGYGMLECVWSLKGPRNINLLGNVSLSDSCDREYIAIYGGLSPEYAELVRICRDNPLPFTNITLEKAFTTLIYHSDEFKPGQSTFRFSTTTVMSCGTKMRVISQSREVKIDKKLYKNNTECIWEYEALDNMYLSVHFIGRFFVENSLNCSKDYIEIQRYDGGLWIPEARFCGREVPAVFNSSSNHIQIAFHTDNNGTGDGFNFVVKASCNHIFNVTSEPHTIYTPRSRRLRIRCEYTFVTDADNAIAIRLLSTSAMPYMKLGSSTPECYEKLFQITKTDENGKSIESDALCLENDAVYAYKSIKLTFNLRSPRLHKLQYSLSTCGGNVTTPGLIIPPMHGIIDGYQDDMRCLWYITAPPDHSVLVQFKYIDIEYHARCEFDAVVIFAGSIYGQNTVSKLCGNVTQPEHLRVLVDSRYAVLAAISDSSSNFYKGFAADISFTRNCNERISLNLGNTPVTLTRQLEFNASETMLCNYNLIAPRGYRVIVQLKELHLNTGVRCSSDDVRCDICNHFEVYDSITVNRISMGKYCNNGVNAKNVTLISSNEDLTLTLQANQPGLKRFEILLQIEKSLCNSENNFELQSDQTLNIIYPPTIDYPLYPANTHCIWQITGAYKYQIYFHMFELQNISQVTGKCSDYVVLETSHYMTKDTKYFCGNATGFYIEMYSSPAENPLYITFHSDTEIESKGFHLIITTHSSCNQTHIDKSSYNLVFRNSERGSIVCIDEVRVPTNFQLNFYISAAYFQDNDCNNTHLKIVDLHSNKTLYDQCESIYELQSLLTTTNAVQIHADNFNEINMLYTASNASLPPGCGGKIYALRGEIKNPPYVIEDRNFSICKWDISVPDPHSITFTFGEFNMGSTTNCEFDFIEIADYKQNGQKLNTKRFCGSTSQSEYTTTGSSAVLIAQKSPNFDGLGWTIMFDIGRDSNDDKYSRLLN